MNAWVQTPGCDPQTPTSKKRRTRMMEQDKTTRSRSVASSRILQLPAAIVGICYLAAYVLLTHISYIEPYGAANITPWNPDTGLSFVLVLLFGLRMIPLLFVAPLLGDLALNLSVPWVFELLLVVLIGGVYSAALVYLQRPSVRFDRTLSSMRDLVLLMLVAGVSADSWRRVMWQ